MEPILAYTPTIFDFLADLFVLIGMPLLLLAWLVSILWGWMRDFIKRNRPPDTP